METSSIDGVVEGVPTNKVFTNSSSENFLLNPPKNFPKENSPKPLDSPIFPKILTNIFELSLSMELFL